MPVRWLFRLIVAAGCLVVPMGAMAADLFTPAPAPIGQCIMLERTHLLELPPAELRHEVEVRFAHAVETAEREDIVYSARPAHTWAMEARQTCAKAIGYLRGGTVHEFEISRCACHYQRMLHFMR